MQKNKNKRFLALAGGLALTFGTIVTPFTIAVAKVPSVQKSSPLAKDPEIENSLLERIKEELKMYSFEVKEEEHYEFDKKIFNSNEEINEYIFKKGELQTHLTSSDPDKIKLPHTNETGVLDKDKIYFINNDTQFKLYYEDAYHNAIDNRNAALNSFININNSKPQYSYDGIDWYDDEKEAATAFKKAMKISQSYYYYIDGKYYNAFNEGDIDLLLAKMKEGYYTNIEKSLSGGNAENSREIYGVKDEFAMKMKKEFRDDFSKNYHKKLINFNGTNSLRINRIKGSTKIEILRRNIDQWVKEEESYTLNFGKNKFNNFSEMLEDFADLTKWTLLDDVKEKKTNYNQEKITLSRYKRDFEVYSSKTNKFEYVTLTITRLKEIESKKWIPDGSTSGGGRYDITYKAPQLNLENDLIIEDKTFGKIDYFLDEAKTISWDNSNDDGGKIYKPELKNDDIIEFYEAWFENYLERVILDFGANNNNNLNWFLLKNGLLDETYFDSIKNKTVEFKPGTIYKDKMYAVNSTKGYNQSLMKSMKEWQKIKEEIIANASKTSEAKKYEIAPGFKVSRKDLDNFLYLEGTGIDARVMYSILPGEHSSDLTGKFLAPTKIQAEELKYLFSDSSLKRRYIIFDNHGKKYPPVTGDKETAMNKIRSQIKLNSRYVHLDEVNSWPEEEGIGRTQTWDNIISNNIYHVYSIGIHDSYGVKQRLYFNTKDNALNAIKDDVWIIRNNKINRVKDTYFVYNFLMKKGEQDVIVPLKYYANQIDSTAAYIYRYRTK